MTNETNAVERAVDAVGGPTLAASICQVSSPTMGKWRRDGVIRLALPAVRLARHLKQMGTAITLDDLIGA